MSEQNELSAADAALRECITTLSVHIPCGDLRGPIPADYHDSELRGVWQSCYHEDTRNVLTFRMNGEVDQRDVSRALDLCIVCLRGTAGGTTRRSWLACTACRGINSALHRAWGVRPLALAGTAS